MRTRLGLATMIMFGALGVARPAQARVDIQVDLASQTMRVQSSTGSYEWPISSARSGYRTPRGSFGVQRMEAMHYSHKYHNSPMPHSLFFAGGYAIHGTYETGALGRPASHGCIRIAPENAAALYQMVREEGARISIDSGAPVDTLYADAGADADAGPVVDRPRRANRRVRSRVAGYRHHRYDDSYAMRGGYGRALGYAPVATPSLGNWLDDPSGF